MTSTRADRLRVGLLAALSLAACRDPGTQESPGGVEIPDETGSRADSGQDTSTEPPPGPVQGLAGLDALGVRNLVLIHADTLRADHLPAYGYARDTTPLLGARPWMVVDRLYATSSWTVPSTASMLASLGVEDHGITHVTDAHVPNAGLTVMTLAEQLKAAGFATFGGNGNQVMPTVDGLTDGFDVQTSAEGTDGRRELDELTEPALDWLDGLAPDERFFLYFQPMDAHGPYMPEEFFGTWTDADALPFEVSETTEADQFEAYVAAFEAAATDEERERLRQALRDVYDESVLHLDAAVGALLEALDARGLADDTLIVFAADHGETLSEDPEYPYFFGHGGTVRPELVHVPLLFLHPRLEASTESCLASNVDLAPTVLQALGVSPLADGVGQPLQDGCRELVYASTFFNNTGDNRVAEEMATDGRSMLRVSCYNQLVFRYDLDADPTAQVSVGRSELANEAALEQGILAFHATLEANTGAEPCDLGFGEGGEGSDARR